MSIEANLKRIADALEKIAEGMGSIDITSSVIKVPVAETPTAPPVAKEVPPAPAPAPAPTPAPAVVALTDEQMNAELLAEFKRLGNDRTKIDTVMTEKGVTGVTGLTAEVQQDILGAVRALQP